MCNINIYFLVGVLYNFVLISKYFGFFNKVFCIFVGMSMIKIILNYC